MTQNKSFKDRNWKTLVLISPNRDVAESNFHNFFYPLFEKTKIYRRLSGYFSSSSLKYLCEGISELIENDGIMYLITSTDLTPADIEAIKKSNSEKEYYLSKTWNSILEEAEGNVELKDSCEALAWLLANGRLFIKIGANLKNGNAVSNNESKFHEKMAIYEDFEGNYIMTLGSVNETASGYVDNRESFGVQEGWRDSSDIDLCLEEFNRLWENTDPYSETMDFTVALTRKLIRFVPEDANYRFRRRTKHSKSSNSEKPNKRELREYQQIAIDNWVKCDCKGILNMATGTGKTFTALNAVKQNCSLEEGILLIVAPQYEIAKQWEKDCRDVFDKNVPVLLCSNHNSKWKFDISDRLHNSIVEFNIIIVINNTFSKDYFYDLISPYVKIMTIIVDEVHEIGSPKSREKIQLLGGIPKRIGLSATPERMRDIEGNNAILNFFGTVVYTFTMHEAIYPKSNDPKDRYLCPYDYYMHYSQLSKEELEEYHKITDEIKKYYIPEDKPKSRRRKIYDHLCRKRAAIIKGSADRLEILKIILQTYDKTLNPHIKDTYSKCIIYCNTIKESKEIYNILNELNLNAAEYHNDIKSREEVLKSFSSSSFVRYLISIGCLDQGVDLPVCDGAIILSSTTNTRQYIQRRGRVLRTNDGKKTKAYIHDVIVLPYKLDLIIEEKEYLDDIESKIISKQIIRAETFIDDSDNPLVNEHKIIDLKRTLW